jgi:hypothetical protein
VLALAVTLGGTLLIFYLSRRARGLDPDAYQLRLLGLSARFERYFWLALGLLVLTGFGGLGGVGPALPALSTGWVLRLVLALLGVLVFLLLAGLRMVTLIRLTMAGEDLSPQVLRLFPVIYGGTGLALVGLVLLAVAVAGLFVPAAGA